jgi:hypothetical protein
MSPSSQLSHLVYIGCPPIVRWSYEKARLSGVGVGRSPSSCDTIPGSAHVQHRSRATRAVSPQRSIRFALKASPSPRRFPGSSSWPRCSRVTGTAGSSVCYAE